jgi:hypothetical protein
VTKLYLAPLLCIIYTALLNGAYAQSLIERNRPETKSISIDVSTDNIDLPKSLQVNNNSAVTIVVRKKPINSCEVKFTTEALPKQDIVGQLFSLLAPLSGGKAAALTAFNIQTGPVGAANPIDQPLEDEIEHLGIMIDGGRTIIQTYSNVAAELDRFSKCRDASDDICTRRAGESDDSGILARVTAARDNLRQDVDSALNLPTLDVTTINATAAALENRVLARAADTVNPPDPTWLQSAILRLQQDRGALAVAGGDLQNLPLAGNQMKKIQSILASLTPSMNASLPLRPVSNRLMKGTLTCQNPFSPSAAANPVPFMVTYQNPPTLTISAGTLVSLFSKRPIGIRSQSTPCASGTGNNCIAVTSTSRTQFVPMGLGNIYVSGSRNFNFNLTGGIGINLNNGGTQVEYFTGPSLGIRGFYLAPGIHIARVPKLGGGFNLGQAAPSGVSGSTLPISYYTALHFGIAFSHSATPQPKPPSN